METTYTNEKLLFYTDLRTDELVQNIGAEQEIMDLTERMILYLDHANQVSHALQRQMKDRVDEKLRNLSTNFEDVQDEKVTGSFRRLVSAINRIYARIQKPMVLDFEDIRTIAYCVGTHQGNKASVGRIRRMFSRENPLDPNFDNLDFP